MDTYQAYTVPVTTTTTMTAAPVASTVTMYAVMGSVCGAAFIVVVVSLTVVTCKKKNV